MHQRIGRAPCWGLALIATLLLGLVAVAPAAAQDVLLRPRWTGTLNFGPRTETNVGMLPGQTDSDVSGRASLELIRHFAWRRLRIDLSGDGSAVVYGSSTQYNRLGGGLAFNGTFRLSPQSTLHIAETFRSDYAREVPRTDLAQIGPEQTEVRTYVTSVDLTHIVSRSTTFSLTGSADAVSFPSATAGPEPIPIPDTATTSTLTGGQTFSMRSTLSRRGDGGRTLAIAVEYQGMRSDQSFGHTVNLSGSFGQRFYGPWRADFDLGAAVLRPLGGVDFVVRPVGTFKLEGRLRRHTLSLSYGTRVAQAYGFARTDLLHDISVAEDARVTRHVNLVVRAQQSLSRAADRTASYGSSNGSVQLRWTLSRHVRLLTSYQLQRLSFGDQDAALDHAFSVGVTASRTWR
jgi:hypothetical protein